MDPYIHDKATVMGGVRFGRHCSVWPGAVLRADMNDITLGDCVHIQDNATLHVDSQRAMEIGAYSLVAHNAVVHGSTIGRGCLIGIGSIVLDGTEIGDGAAITAGCVLRGGTRIPAKALVTQKDGRLRVLEGKARPALVVAGSLEYAELARRARRGLFARFCAEELSNFRVEAEQIVCELGLA